MSNNIYEPPQAQPPNGTGPGEGNSGRAIPLTIIFDYAVTHLLTFVLAAFVTSFYMSQGKTIEDITAIFESASLFSSINLMFLALGLSVSFVSGYMCAKWSVKNVWRDIVIVMLISQVIETFLYWDRLSFGEYMFLTIIETIVMVLGVNRWVKQHKKYWKKPDLH